MKAQNHMSKKNIVLITESSNKIEEILCKAIFCDFTTQVAKEKEAVIDICKENEIIVLSTSCTDTTTEVYKHSIKGKLELRLLKEADVDETDLDDESILCFTLFNLGLFGKKSIRAKTSFLVNNTIGDVRSEGYENIFDLELMNKAPLLYLNLYRVIAFDNHRALIKIFDLLQGLEIAKISTYLDSFLTIIIKLDITTEFSEILIKYYEGIVYVQNNHKFLIFQFLNKIYANINKTQLIKIRNWCGPILNYCLFEDNDGQYVDLMNSYVNSCPTVTTNLITSSIVIHAKVLGNHKYIDAFYSKLAQPKSKLEHSYHNLLLKIENLVDTQKLGGIPELQLKRGVDQYIKFLQDNNKPAKCSPMFELLLS